MRCAYITRFLFFWIGFVTVSSFMIFECRGAGLYQYGVWQANDRILSSPFVDGVVAYFGWNVLEPEEGFIDLEPVFQIRSRAQAAGKKLLIRIVTAELTPTWVYRRGVPRVVDTTDKDPRWVPLYWHPQYLEFFDSFIGRVGKELDGDPSIEAVQVGIGRYGEMCLEGSDWLKRGFSSSLWTDTCISILNTYRRRFNKTQLLVMIMSADLPDGRRTKPMEEVASYAAAHGIGLQFNGLSPDNSYLWGLKEEPANDSAIGIFRRYGGHVPLSFELTSDKVDPRLSCMNALSERASYLSVHTSLLANRDLEGLFAFTHYYLGKDVKSSEAVWSLLRQTSPEAGIETGKKNYEFGLRQVEFSEKASYPLKNKEVFYTGKTIALRELSGLPCRRTIGSNSDYFIGFKVSPEFNPSFKPKLSVVYADVGMDSWRLLYMTDRGLAQAGSVQKQNSGKWMSADFELHGLTTGHPADLLIDSNADGDEYIHYVQLNREGSIIPLPLSLPHVSPLPLDRGRELE